MGMPGQVGIKLAGKVFQAALAASSSGGVRYRTHCGSKRLVQYFLAALVSVHSWNYQLSCCKLFTKSRNSLRREIGCILIIQQKFRKFEFSTVHSRKIQIFGIFRTQPISVLNLFLLYHNSVLVFSSKIDNLVAVIQ